MSKPAFKRIGIIGKHRSYDIASSIVAIINYLQQQQYDIIAETHTANTLEQQFNGQVMSAHELAEHIDVAIIIGGDGSLLQAAHVMAPHNVPLIGVNRGRLGFLTDIKPGEFSRQIEPIFHGEYQEEQRFMLHANVIDNDKMLADNDALNDIVLMPGECSHMIEFDVYINQQFACPYRADGLIISTPTGSTAYALSGGGPILHPTLDAIVLVPMFPHTLSSRPLVVSANNDIRIVLNTDNLGAARVSCDGQPRVSVPAGSEIQIKKLPYHLRLLHPRQYDYYETLRSKLGWVVRH